MPPFFLLTLFMKQMSDTICVEQNRVFGKNSFPPLPLGIGNYIKLVLI